MTTDTVRRARAEAVVSASGGLPFARSALALVLVVLAGALCLAMPFWGDQALFAVYGREMADGAVLYRDLFDLKQPGIFYFYALGGLLFGFTDVGIHAFELVYWLAFSLFAIVALRPYLRWAGALVPVFTVVAYYLYAQLLDLTQIEILAGFPLLLAWWLVDRAEPGTRAGRAWYAAAGAVTAAVVLLKHLYVLIVLAFLVYALLRARRAARGVDIARALVWFGTGLALPLALAAAYFAAHGQLERIWWAYVEWAPRAAALDPQPLSNLTGGARRFVLGHAPLVILAVVGAVHGLRERTRPQLDLVVGMLLWGLVGAAVVSVQFWGEWHWLLFTVPVGILAVVGVEALLAPGAERPRRARAVALGAAAALGLVAFFAGTRVAVAQRWLLLPVAVGIAAAVAAAAFSHRPGARRRLEQVLAAALAISVGLAAVAPVSKLAALVEHDLALSADARAEYQRSVNAAYGAADEDLGALRRRGAASGPMYVFGDPVVLYRANRPQAVPIHGWGPEKLDARAWHELDRDLRATRPSHVVVDDHSASVIRDRRPEVLEFIETRYEVELDGTSGIWYARR